MLNLIKSIKFYKNKNYISLFKYNFKLFSEEQQAATPKFKTELIDDLQTAKKQIFWRIRNIGQLELEFVVMKWYEAQNLNLNELKDFSIEVLEMENPEMNKYFVQFEPVPDNLPYTKRIQQFILK